MRVISAAIHSAVRRTSSGAAGIGRHALDAQELVQLLEVLGVVLAEIGERRIGACGRFRSRWSCRADDRRDRARCNPGNAGASLRALKLLLAALLAIGIASVPLAQPPRAAARLGGARAGSRSSPTQSSPARWSTRSPSAPTAARRCDGGDGPRAGAPSARRSTPSRSTALPRARSVPLSTSSPAEMASCGVSFGLSERWLVFTTWDGACTATGLLRQSQPEKGTEAPLPLTAPPRAAQSRKGWAFRT